MDGVILEAGGFSLFRDREKLAYLKRLAREQGLILLTDSDGAGFVIRGKLASHIPPEHLKHAYIPDVYGKERRKAKPSKEGKLGVEGMDLATLRAALERAGATILEGEAAPSPVNQGEPVTKSDLFQLGLSGKADSASAGRSCSGLWACRSASPPTAWCRPSTPCTAGRNSSGWRGNTPQRGTADMELTREALAR